MVQVRLPTASAVVGDLVAMAKHLGKNIYMEWKDEKLELADPNKQENRYFVRAHQGRGAIAKVFLNAEIIDMGVDNELGFVTPKMLESEFNAKKEELGEVFQVIRMA